MNTHCQKDKTYNVESNTQSLKRDSCSTSRLAITIIIIKWVSISPSEWTCPLNRSHWIIRIQHHHSCISAENTNEEWVCNRIPSDSKPSSIFHKASVLFFWVSEAHLHTKTERNQLANSKHEVERLQHSPVSKRSNIYLTKILSIKRIETITKVLFWFLPVIRSTVPEHRKSKSQNPRIEYKTVAFIF